MWKIPPQDLDYCYYLPVFFDGFVADNCENPSHANKFQFLPIRLCEPKFPYNVLACYAVHDMLNAGGEKVLPVIPQLVIPMKNALNGKSPGVMASTLRIIQHLCMCGWYQGFRIFQISILLVMLQVENEEKDFFLKSTCRNYMFPSGFLFVLLHECNYFLRFFPQLHMIPKQMSFTSTLNVGSEKIH